MYNILENEDVKVLIDPLIKPKLCKRVQFFHFTLNNQHNFLEFPNKILPLLKELERLKDDSIR